MLLDRLQDAESVGVLAKSQQEHTRNGALSGIMHGETIEIQECLRRTVRRYGEMEGGNGELFPYECGVSLIVVGDEVDCGGASLSSG